MNSKVVVSRNDYGGFVEHIWTLEVSNGVETKSFLLGQDVKFCSRVLGMSPKYIVEQIGDNDFDNEETLVKLGNFIVEVLELDEEKVFELQDWDLCCQ